MTSASLPILGLLHQKRVATLRSASITAFLAHQDFGVRRLQAHLYCTVAQGVAIPITVRRLRIIQLALTLGTGQCIAHAQDRGVTHLLATRIDSTRAQPPETLTGALASESKEACVEESLALLKLLA